MQIQARRINLVFFGGVKYILLLYKFSRFRTKIHSFGAKRSRIKFIHPSGASMLCLDTSVHI
jgi:hypothetical protein